MAAHSEAFAIVQKLAAELSGGQVELPSLPQAIVRLRNELAKPGFDVQKLAQLAATEPALAGSILTMANSAACRRAGRETLELKVAIPRIGADKVQALAMRFAVRQLQGNRHLGRSKALLEREWAHGLRVAAICYMIAERSRQLNPDEAMIIGLIHNVGRIYLLSRADDYPTLFDSQEILMDLVNSWHASVAKAIVESWGLPAAAVEAVGVQSEEDSGPRGFMSDVLRLALALGEMTEQPTAEVFQQMASGRSCRGLRLAAADLAAIWEGHEETRLSLGLTD
jgi:HD-like signal output (HDOD) protein